MVLQYSGSVDENVADVVVMRIKAVDKDLAHSDNWLTVFTIAQGNEDNLFSIETDKNTNEGILKLIKVLFSFSDFNHISILFKFKCSEYMMLNWSHMYFFLLFSFFSFISETSVLGYLHKIAGGF